MRKSFLQSIARDERGGLGYNALWICFVIIFLIPFFWDVASVHYARRFSGAGADAGSLAAAQEYARQLQYVPQWNGIFRGSCPLQEYTPQQVVLRYKLNPAFGAPPGIGYSQAESYVGQNGDGMDSYRSWPEYAGRVVAGVPIPWIKVAIDTGRHVNTAYGPIYQKEFDVPNKALAVAYLWQWNMTPRPCGNGYNTYDFTFEWKITLDKAR